MRYYSADQHWHHRNIVDFTRRPFVDVGAMNYGLVTSWNRVVRYDSDQVFNIGDMFMLNASSRGFDFARQILEKLNGQIFIIPGNHDQKLWKWIKNNEPDFLEERKITICDMIHEIKTTEPNGVGLYLVLCHYPMLGWNRRSYNSIHMHGHTHSRDKFQPGDPKRIHVGVDAWNMEPVREDEIINHIRDQERLQYGKSKY